MQTSLGVQTPCHCFSGYEGSHIRGLDQQGRFCYIHKISKDVFLTFPPSPQVDTGVEVTAQPRGRADIMNPLAVDTNVTYLAQRQWPESRPTTFVSQVDHHRHVIEDAKRLYEELQTTIAERNPFSKSKPFSDAVQIYERFAQGTDFLQRLRNKAFDINERHLLSDLFHLVLKAYINKSGSALSSLNNIEMHFNLMRELGLQDGKSFNQMINAYASFGDMDNAFRIYKMMCDAGVTPDIVTLNFILKSTEKAAKEVDKRQKAVQIAEELFRWMLSTSNLRLRPNSFSYNNLLGMYSNAGLHDRVKMIFEGLDSYDKYTLAIVFQSCAWANDFPMARQCFLKILPHLNGAPLKNGTKLNVDFVTLKPLLHLFALNQATSFAEEVFSQMKKLNDFDRRLSFGDAVQLCARSFI